MGLRLQGCRDGMQSVKKTTVPNVLLGCFHQALSDVRVPRGKQADHERAAQDFEVAADCVIGDAERSTKF